MNIIFEDGCILKGTTNENDIDIIDTRVAGIDMPFYAAVLNIISCKNINIKGKGTILGGGRYYYIKYWGIDKKGGYRAIYDKKNLRFAADYDCKRPRNLLIQKSSNINISDIKLEDSGFWNLHILYSNNININNINIISEDPIGPSTDGIDIDSSNNIKITNSIISTNDDGISIKSGRGPDGIRRNIPSYNIKIDNILFNKGYGIAFGSELSAGIYDVDISNITIKKKFLKTVYHKHILVYSRTSRDSTEYKQWFCNNCKTTYENDVWSFYCTKCDFDLCKICAGFS
jgi:polygalacturonase